jgi:hypothetical protein
LELSDYSKQGRNLLVGHQWISQEKERLKIDLNFIAIRFIKYYGNLYFKFRLKQSHNPKDANINLILEKYKNRIGLSVQKINSPDKFLKLMTYDEFKELRKEIIQKSIKPEVLVHLDRENYLYKRIPNENYIVVDISLIYFLKRYKIILHAGINYILTRYLEKINVLPRIAEKISDSYKRTHLNQEDRRLLLQKANGCFYCKRQENVYHMDHVIPFNFVYETKIFNIVPACSSCNRKKWDRLPVPNIFDKVKERNENLTILGDYYNAEWYQELYETCRVGYHGDREFFTVE